ncbi:MAG: hypothetical protein DUD34_03630 [Lactobacillus sp.]|jgi:hypothetical protein|nr:MAG: hypothetical protein DUD34_03630 [Lactobacillus sp.]
MKIKTQTKQPFSETRQIIQVIGYSLVISFILSILGDYLLKQSLSLGSLTAGVTRFYLVVSAVLILLVTVHLIMNERYLRHPVHWLRTTYQLFQNGRLSPTATLSILIAISLIFVQLFSWLTNLLEGRLLI